MSDKKTANNTINLERLKKLIDGEKSRQTIADKFGCDVSLITKHYNGDRIVTIDYLKKYAEYFGVSADYFLDLSDAETSDKDLQFICDYTGLSVDTITFFRYSRLSLLTRFIEYIIYDIYFDDISFYQEYSDLLSTDFHLNDIEDRYFIDCLRLIREINDFEKELNSLEQDKENLMEQLVNCDSNSDEIEEKIEEILGYINATDFQKREKEAALNGNKYHISKVFNKCLDKYFEEEAGE